jgi:predicted ATPase/signal transduction histidine kinase
VIELSQYNFEVLRKDDAFVLYRARRDERSPALVLSPALERPSPETLRRLEHEYSLRNELDSEWAVHPVSLAQHWDRPVLILTDPGAQLLAHFVDKPLDLTLRLRLAIAISHSIGQLHRHDIVHKDIRPANILADPITGRCWLTGFGLASRLPRERQAPDPPEVMAGTFAYMAPEQTGRMNRSIDSRSDLYAFGVALYQLFTGVLPFTAGDPLEWVYCHIARQPVPPAERARVEPTVSAIIMKLLAKNAENRYQTAAGVEHDLRRCLAEWQTGGYITEFSLGEHDKSGRLLVPEKLYGRSQEIETLRVAFERVLADGRPQLVIISGYAGIGKSSVINEVHKMLVPSRGFFASGKFDQYKRDIPYATLAKAIQILIHQILAKSDAEVNEWREALRQALEPNGQVIINIIPELELVIGKQPPLPELSPVDARNRFRVVFQEFLKAFARPEHPLALFLDDLQWVDPATLELLKYLTTEQAVRHLLLLGAYRDNEVSPSHPLMQMLEEVRGIESVVQEIVLKPLSMSDLQQLLSDSLQAEPERVRPLADLLHEKTGGNPFFAIQFLTMLAEENYLVFDQSAEEWKWDLRRIGAKGFTDNVVELMTEKLSRLPEPTREALQQMACLGNNAPVSKLSMVRGDSDEKLNAILWDAVRVGLISRFEGGYAFMHDRVQEAAYALIPESLRVRTHLRFGRLLITKMSPDEIEADIFDVVNQFDSGSTLLSDQREKDMVAELNLRAGKKAKAAAAYDSASLYLKAGMEQVGNEAWDRTPKLAFALWLERAESEFLNGKFEESDRLIRELFDRVNSKTEKVAVYRLSILLHLIRAEYRQALNDGLECLYLFGIEMPRAPTREHVATECENIYQVLGQRSIESLIGLPLMTDPDMQAAMGVLSVMAAPAFNTNINLMYLLFCQMVSLTLKHGTTGASTHGYAELATILGPVFHRYIDGYRFGKLACDLIEKYGFNTYKTKVYFCMQRAMLWTQPISFAVDFIRLAIEATAESHDIVFASFSWHHLITVLLLRGTPLDELWRESQNGMDFVRKVKFRDEDGIPRSQQQFILGLRGEIPLPDTQFDDQRTLTRFAERKPFTAYHHWTLELQLKYILGDYAAASLAAKKAKALILWSEQHIQSVDFYYYGALTAAALCETSRPEERTELVIVVRESLKWFQELAVSCPETFSDKYTLVSAELARIEGRTLEAMTLYEDAVRSARENGFLQNEAISNEVAARFYLTRGLQKVAGSYLRDARYCYVRWGATSKVRQLDELYPWLAEQTGLVSVTAVGAPVSELDLGTVFKASQTVSSEIMIEKLVETLLVIVLEQAGADRGLLIFPRGNEQRIEAEATSVGDKIRVHFRDSLPSSIELPESLLRYAIRTQEKIILSDAAADHLFSEDAYLRRKQPRSVLCLPLIKQRELMGILYLENQFVPNVFAPTRLAALEMIASQAAISLAQAHLYAELSRANEELKRESNERQRAEAELYKKEMSLREAQIELAHFSRITTMGELAASIVHEVTQPLAGMVTNANAGLRWLSGDSPDLVETREALRRIANDGNRAAQIITRIRALAKKAPPQKDQLDLNATIAEVIAMARNEIQENRVSLETKLASDLPLISGDKVQLQQVVLNLLINAVEAMGESAEGPRNLTVSSEMARREAATGPGTAIRDQIGFPEEPSQTPARGGNEGGHVLITVKDSGPGLDLQGLHRLFDAFYTTKRHGLGMGLAISRSIIQAHGGRLWAKPNTPRGAVFQFTLPVQQYTEFQ